MKPILVISILTFALQMMPLSSSAQLTKLHDFALQPDAMYPYGSLISDGIFLYGTTGEGGAHNVGTIFKIKPDGTEYAKIFNFDIDANGRNPLGSLLFDGTFLYGTTSNGSAFDAGTIFKIRPDGSGFTTLFEFSDNARYAVGSLISDGTFLFGMTQNGGLNNRGIIFKIKKDGTSYSKLLDFDLTRGQHPFGDLFSDGTFLYGMTHYGGTSNRGIIFRIKPDGSGYGELMAFDGSSNGRSPQGSFISDGTFLYAMTTFGGANNFGTLFKIKPDGTDYTKLLDFDETANGIIPQGSLTLDGNLLYGMAYAGGARGFGTIFKIKTDGTGYAKLLDFDDLLHGSYPRGSLFSDGAFLYGTAYAGGKNGYGTIFRYALAPVTSPSITTISPLSGAIGTLVTITGTNFSVIPANNVVRFNGTLATITASSTTSITTTVPLGATDGTITVTVAGNTATSISNFSVTTLPSAINIVTQPVDQSLCEGAITTLTVAANGTTNLTYQWQFSNALIGPYSLIINGMGYSNATTATLLINTAGNFGAGFYRCNISGDLASDIITNAAKLVLNAYPTAVISVSSSHLISSAGDRYQWYYSNAPVGGAVNQSFEFNFRTDGVYAVDVTTNGCTTHSSNFVYLVTGEESQEENLTAINVFPNPIQNELFIDVKKQSTVLIFDVMGRNVKEETVSADRVNRIEMQNLPHGTYILVIKSIDKIQYQKIYKTP